MTDKQKEAIKNFDNYKLLDLYNSYYTKMIHSLIADAETTEIFDALRAEILERMGVTVCKTSQVINTI